MANYRNRRVTLLLVFGMLTLLFVFRLFYLQVLSNEFAASAQNNVVKRVVITPARGIIYDRNGRIYVTNKPIFDLVATPKELVIPDTALLAHYLSMSVPDLKKKLKEIWDYSPEQPSMLRQHISEEMYAKLQENLWLFDGISTTVRSTRLYRDSSGANFLGYINEVDTQDIKASRRYYRQGDLIGRTGLERNYESYLRGVKGVRMLIKDVHGREVGPFASGRYDSLPEKGSDIVIGVDADLQAYAERLMQNKVGSVVAIEPATGEILTFVTSPSYDPNLLVGLDFPENFARLRRNPLKPLTNRPLQGYYPPGSIFKLLIAAAALQEGTLTTETFYGCGGGFARNGGRPACHPHPSPLALHGAIQHSCNAYFAATYVDMLHHHKFGSFVQGFRKWRSYMDAFGIGRKLGIDIPFESKGNLPTEAFYDRHYGPNRWKGMTIVSNAIGQGEIIMTPLQMANVAAVFANRGWFIAPHFFKGLYNASGTKPVSFPRQVVPIDTAHFNRIVDAMNDVVGSGTGYAAFIPDIPICGKTGTAQNPHGDDHAVFIAFAPKENPKIAIACIIENAGFGGVWAAPLASLVIEKYLRGSIPPERKYREDYVLSGDFIP